MVDTGHYTFAQTRRMHNTKSEPQCNYKLQAIIMCQRRFINCNKRTTLVGDVDNGGAQS